MAQPSGPFADKSTLSVGAGKVSVLKAGVKRIIEACYTLDELEEMYRSKVKLGPTSDNVEVLMGRSPLLQISSSVTPKLHLSATFPIGVPLSIHSGAIHGIRAKRSAVLNTENENDPGSSNSSLLNDNLNYNRI